MSCKDCKDSIEFEKTFEEGIPYIERQINNNTFYREFNSDVNPNWLKWHWDEQKRVVKVIEDSDWMFQYDDELPFKLSIGTTVTIPEGKYHRVIKGTTSLKLEIYKF